jgi:hypothetical protein
VLTRMSPLADLTPTHPTSLLFDLLSHLGDMLPDDDHSARGSRRFPESLGDRRSGRRNRRRFLNAYVHRFSFVSYISPVDTIRSLSIGVDPGTIWVHILRPDCGLIEDDDPHSKMYPLVNAETAKDQVTTICVTFSDRTILPSGKQRSRCKGTAAIMNKNTLAHVTV